MNANSGIIFFKLFQAIAAKIAGYFFHGLHLLFVSVEYGQPMLTPRIGHAVKIKITYTSLIYAASTL